ncbi:MAG: hypothetical protein ABI891_04075 [Acidobacteriota bacterium]
MLIIFVTTKPYHNFGLFVKSFSDDGISAIAAFTLFLICQSTIDLSKLKMK